MRKTLVRFTDTNSLYREGPRLSRPTRFSFSLSLVAFLTLTPFLSGLVDCQDAAAQPGHASAYLTALQTVSHDPSLAALGGAAAYVKLKPYRLPYAARGDPESYRWRFGNARFWGPPPPMHNARLTFGVAALAHINLFETGPDYKKPPLLDTRIIQPRILSTPIEVERLHPKILLRYQPTPKKRPPRPKIGKKPDPGFEFSLPDGPKRNPGFEKLGFDAVLAKGDELFREGGYAKALEAYQTALRKDPGSSVALWAIAHAQFADGDFDSAAASMHGALQVQPDLFIHAGIVRMFYGKTDDYDARMGALALRVRRNRNDFRGTFLAGVMLGLDAHCDLAGDHLEGALQLNPDDSLIPELLRSLDAEAIDDRHDGHQDEPDPKPGFSVE